MQLPAATFEILENSTKMVILLEILEQAKLRKEKVVLFSNRLATFHVIQEFLKKLGENDWVEGFDYFVFHGSKTAAERVISCDTFNDTERAKWV